MSRTDGSLRGDQRSREDKPHAAGDVAAMPGERIGRTASAVVRATGELQREAAHQLRMATNPAELMTVQTALMVAGWQHSIRCTTELANAWFALGAAGAVPHRRGPRMN